ncbi:MAG: DUF4142 domain-containing protein [Acidobacteriaceae bacterium]
MKRMFALVCCLALGTVPALAAQKKAAGMPMTDQQFVDFAAQTDMVEANLGQLAQNNASSQDVKDYGQMLVTDHTNDFSQLHTAALSANLTVPDSIDTAHDKAMITPMEKLKGAAFDRGFIRNMVAGHTKVLAVYKKEATDAQNDALKSYAEAAIPTLQKHLDQAKDLEKSGGKKK